MSGIDYIVPPMKWDQIHDLTEKIRGQFGLTHEPHFPIIDFIERVLDNRLGWLSLQTGDFAGTGGAEGLTDPNGTRIILREDVYAGACRENGRARFTCAHELGHWVMHTRLPMARAGTGIEPFRRSEPQANQFAAELLMPRDFFQDGDDVLMAVRRHGVSQEAAQARLAYLRKRGIIK